MQPMNVPNTIRRLDHSGTYTLDDIVAISLLRREVITKKWKRKEIWACLSLPVIEGLRFGEEDEDEDEEEALCFRHNEIFKLFCLQLGRDDEVDCNNIVTPSLSRI